MVIVSLLYCVDDDFGGLDLLLDCFDGCGGERLLCLLRLVGGDDLLGVFGDLAAGELRSRLRVGDRLTRVIRIKYVLLVAVGDAERLDDSRGEGVGERAADRDRHRITPFVRLSWNR